MQIEQLEDRFDILESRAEQRGMELDDVSHKLGDLHSQVHKVESWLGTAVRSLKRESTDFDHGSLKVSHFSNRIQYSSLILT